MTNRKSYAGAFALAATVGVNGCANTPNVKTTYYLPRAVTQIQVTQSFVCPVTKASQELSVTAAVAATTTYSADYGAGEQFLDFGGYSTPFADIDLSVTRSPDKRLLGINSSSIGEGSTILQDVISLGTTIAKVAGVAATVHGGGGPGEGSGSNPCDVVRAHFTGDASKTPPTVSIIYSANILYGEPANKSATAAAPTSLPIAIDPETTSTAPSGQPSWLMAVNLSADPASAPLQEALRGALQKSSDPFAFTVKVANAYPLANDVAWAGAASASPGDSVVVLRRTFNADLQLDGPVFLAAGSKSSVLWRGAVAVPIHDTYPLPLPTPALFGKTQFALTLTDAGTISKIEYGTTSGAPDSVNAATDVAKAFVPESASTKASEVQAKSDLIYQQQRYSQCKLNPSLCPAK